MKSECISLELPVYVHIQQKRVSVSVDDDHNLNSIYCTFNKIQVLLHLYNSLITFIIQ